MHQQAVEISRRFLHNINSDGGRISLADIKKAGFPVFLYKRIRFTIEQKIGDEFFPHHSDWVDVEAPEVQKAWPSFKAQLLANVHITPKKCKVVCQAEVENMLRVLTQPRTFLPEFIFGDEEVLGSDDIQQRISRLTVYKHFGKAIPLYMQKRGLESLSKERCRLLIEKLDANLVQNYQTEDWVQLLEPLFELCGSTVHAELLQQFFADKELPSLAENMRKAGGSVDKKQFARLLNAPPASSADASPQTQENADITSAGGSNGYSPSPQKEEKTLADSFLGEEAAEKEVEEAEEENENSFNALFRENENRDAFFEAFEEQMDTGAAENELTSPTEEEPETDFVDESCLFEEAKTQEPAAQGEAESDEDIQALFADEQPEESVDAQGAEAEANAMEEDEDDSPIWHQFMSEEELAALDEGLEDEEMIIDEGTLSGFDNEEAEALKDWLKNEQGRYINEIFKNSADMYEQALQQIAQMDGWNEAAEYIRQQVFTPHHIDMFSETAIDFTDRLQNYFEEQNN